MDTCCGGWVFFTNGYVTFFNCDVWDFKCMHVPWYKLVSRKEKPVGRSGTGPLGVLSSIGHVSFMEWGWEGVHWGWPIALFPLPSRVSISGVRMKTDPLSLPHRSTVISFVLLATLLYFIRTRFFLSMKTCTSLGLTPPYPSDEAFTRLLPNVPRLGFMGNEAFWVTGNPPPPWRATLHPIKKKRDLTY